MHRHVRQRMRRLAAPGQCRFHLELSGEEVHHEHALKEAVLLLILCQLLAKQISASGGLGDAICGEQGIDSFFTLAEHLECSASLVVGIQCVAVRFHAKLQKKFERQTSIKSLKWSYYLLVNSVFDYNRHIADFLPLIIG
jgi:hypothetical protein